MRIHLLIEFKALACAAILLLYLPNLQAQTQATQPIENWNSSKILHEMERAAKFGRVLYLAAHPDDENTRLIAYFNQTEGATAGYLSLTRGDGGQNLIGLEKGEGLGLIRTHELLRAREIDGGTQFFTRAIDFGYSKSPEESLAFWGKEIILGDVVRVIRMFRPDAIICRFPEDGRGGHGHHTASALLAHEAYFAAASDTAFPEQLEELEPHRTKKLYFNTSSWWIPELRNIKASNDSILVIDAGQFNALLGEAPNECAARSRSMHKSQGFGSAPDRGSQFEYLVPLEGNASTPNFWEGIARTWTDWGYAKLDKAWRRIIADFRPAHPEESLPQLWAMLDALNQTDLPAYLKEEKIRAVEQLILQCAGLRMEARVSKPVWMAGEKANVDLQVLARNVGKISVEVEGRGMELELNANQMESAVISGLSAPERPTEPFWLRNPHEAYLFQLDGPDQIGAASHFPVWSIPVRVKMGSVSIRSLIPVLHQSVDPVRGELYQVATVIPAMSISTAESTMYFASMRSRKISVGIRSYAAQEDVVVTPQVTDGFSVFPASVRLGDMPADEERYLTFDIIPDSTHPSKSATLTAVATSTRGKFSDHWQWMDYDHLPKRSWKTPAQVQLTAPDIKVNSKLRIGYIMGSGDDIPVYLEQLGYEVTLLDEGQFARENLSDYDVIVVGIRAYNVHPWLARVSRQVEQYIRQGGRWLVQYQTRGFDTSLLPVAFEHGRNRVTDEHAVPKFPNPEHSLLQAPNRITSSDFEGWVQERGLYFANSWDSSYVPLIGWSDAGEPTHLGSVISAHYGKGAVIYTGISFFRQLPAGVGGAMRLFVNLLQGPIHTSVPADE